MNNVVLMTNFFLGRMRRMFFMSYPETNRDYKKSRICYTVADSAAQTIVQLAGGTFLVTLMEALHISDGNMGIIASLGSFAAIAQIISIKLSKSIKKNKLFISLTILQKIWFAFIFFIPLMGLESGLGQVLMIICYFFAQTCLQIGTPALVDWIASLVPDKVRGRYFSIKDSVAVFVVVTVMLIMGIVVDLLSANHSTLMFLLLGAVTGILVLINIIAIAKMKEPKLAHLNAQGKEMIGDLAKKNTIHHKDENKVKLLEELKLAFGTKKFRQLLYLNCLWLTAFYIASPFNSSLQVKDLELPYTFIMIIGYVTNLLRVFLLPRAGKLADKIGMTKVMAWSLWAMGAHYFFMALSNRNNAYIMAIFAALFSSLAWTFIGTGMLGIQLQCLTKEKRIVQYSILTMISGIYGFLVSILGGKIIDFIHHIYESNGKNSVHAQMYTNSLGVVFIIITVLYLKITFEKKQQ